MKRIYLLTTEHLENGLWFREDEDFKVAINYIAIEAACHPDVIVLSFIPMSNHIHFVLRGIRDTVVAFINSFKGRYSLYYRRKYGVKEFLRGNELDVQLVPYDNEAVEKAIAYVLMNCVAAGICAHPSQYPWGTASAFFNSSKPSGKCVREFSGRALKRLLHSYDINLPPNWIIGKDGFILPSSYIDVKWVESLYRTPQRMNYFLQNSSKAKKRIKIAEGTLPAFRDQTILSALPDLCRSLFNKNNFAELSQEEKSEYARQIRYRFSADATQIARVCGVSYSDAAKLLDAV